MTEEKKYPTTIEPPTPMELAFYAKLRAELLASGVIVPAGPLANEARNLRWKEEAKRYKQRLIKDGLLKPRGWG